MRRLMVLGAMMIAAAALPAGPAAARWYGSTLKGKANATYGCSAAIVMGPLGGFDLVASGQRSCTYRHGGYLNSARATFYAPRTGWIKRIRVKAGKHPAKLRLTILTGSSRVNPYTGQDVPGTYTCCTARYVGRAFRPRAHRVTTRRVSVPVFNVRSKKLRYRIHSSDGVALSAVGPGRLPLHVSASSLGSFDSGTPLSVSYFPYTRRGDPRVDGYSLTGIDVLYRWDFRRHR